MLKLPTISEVFEDQLSKFSEKETGIERNIEFEKYVKTPQITVVSGVRRSGKSTLLVQFSKRFSNFYYANFDDERLSGFTVEDFQQLMTVFRKHHESKVIFLDEIQNVVGWERFVRRIHDEGYKVFITGSNAKLLSSELATHLTGRYVKIEIYPFSFAEILSFRGVDAEKKTSMVKADILKCFDEYVLKGGFPEFLKLGDEEILQRIYDDILYKDLLVRFKIREVKAFKQLAAFLFTNFSKETSYNSLKETLGFKSTTSVKNYVEFMQESFLVSELYKYDFSLKKQFVSDKKIYVVDNGLRNAVAFSFSEDIGRLLENLAFVELKRRGLEVYFYKGTRECDFLVKEKSKITQAIQVSCDMDMNNREREESGLMDALRTFRLKEGIILTQYQEDTIEREGHVIHVVPLWKWLLGKE